MQSDISTLYAPSDGISIATPSGYLLTDGTDISTLYAPSDGITISNLSNFLLPDGTDISTLYKPLYAIPTSVIVSPSGYTFKNSELKLNGWIVGQTTWMSNISDTVEVIVIGGGGDGGYPNNSAGGGGGGGAGGFLRTNVNIETGQWYNLKFGINNNSYINNNETRSSTIFGDFTPSVIAYGGGVGGTTNTNGSSGYGPNGGKGGLHTVTNEIPGVGIYGAAGSGAGGGGGGTPNKNNIPLRAGAKGGNSIYTPNSLLTSLNFSNTTNSGVYKYCVGGNGGKAWSAGFGAIGGSGGGDGIAGAGHLSGGGGAGGPGVIVLTYNGKSIIFTA